MAVQHGLEPSSSCGVPAWFSPGRRDRRCWQSVDLLLHEGEESLNIRNSLDVLGIL